jgi:hypothetical protein
MLQYISLLSLFAMAIYVLNDTTWKRVVAAATAPPGTQQHSDADNFIKQLQDRASSVRASLGASLRSGKSHSGATVLAVTAAASRSNSISLSGTTTAPAAAAGTADTSRTAAATAAVADAASVVKQHSVQCKALGTSSLSAWLAARFGKRERAVAAGDAAAADCESGLLPLHGSSSNSKINRGSSDSCSTTLVEQFTGSNCSAHPAVATSLVSRQQSSKLCALEERTREDTGESYMLQYSQHTT